MVPREPKSPSALARAGVALPLLIAGLLFIDAFSRMPDNQPFTYPLDDAYIHLAMARQLVESGNWGVTPTEFAPASSSLGWTVLLALGHKLGGDRVPIVLNLLAAVALLLVIYRRWLPSGVVAAVVATSVTVAVLPLVPLTFLGMEHVLHALASVLFAIEAVSVVEGAAKKSRWTLGVLAFAVVALRFEGLFLIGSVAALLLVRHRRLDAALTLSAGLAPVLLFGMFSLSQGGLFLPSSVLLKGNLPPSSGFSEWLLYSTMWIQVLWSDKELGGIVLLCGLGWFSKGARANPRARDLSLLIIVSVLAHAQFARVGWFGRYEAYLLALGSVGLAAYGPQLAARWTDLRSPFTNARRLVVPVAIVAIIASCWGTLVQRATRGLRKLPLAVVNVHQQQRQMARFIATQYAGRPVALNDIGAVCYASDIELLDFWGLGDLEVTLLVRSGRWNVEAAEQLSRERGVEVAILYEQYFAEYIPRSWHRVGTWTIDNNVACASSTVSFYAIDRERASLLRARLENFHRTMPPSIRTELD